MKESGEWNLKVYGPKFREKCEIKARERVWWWCFRWHTQEERDESDEEGEVKDWV